MRLPDFICPGPIKCGTTQLYVWLKQHPQIFLNDKIKEINFFNTNFHKGLPWYSNFFVNCGKDSMAGDISPTYFQHKQAPYRISSVIPNAKLIFILRNPVDRIYSQYKHYVMYTGYSFDFEKYLFDHPIAIEISNYSKHIKAYLDYFPKDQVQFCLFEEFISNSQVTLKKIFSFLDIDTSFLIQKDSNRVNQSQIPRHYFIFKTLKKLSQYMRKYNMKIPKKVIKNQLFESLIFMKDDQIEHRYLLNSTKKRLAEHLYPDVEIMSQIMGFDLLGYWNLDVFEN